MVRGKVGWKGVKRRDEGKERREGGNEVLGRKVGRLEGNGRWKGRVGK